MIYFFFIFIAVNVFSQENFIKTGITNPFLGDFNLSYERIIGEKSSIQVKAGYLNPRISLFISENTITPNQYTFIDDKGGFHASVEYRFYLSKTKSYQGLYLAPFIRHFNQKLLYTDEIRGDIFNVDLKVNNFGIGAQLGYQIIINEIFTLDFYFLGLSLDNYNGKMKYTLDQPRTGFDYSTITSDIDQSFEDYNFLKDKLEHTIKPDRNDTRIPFIYPGIRIGISAGIAF